jgi:arylsulfatase A-like enzyme
MIDNGKPVKHRGYVTDIITREALGWLERRDRTKPFLLMVQHKAPHREWAPSLRHLGHDGDRVYPVPATFFDSYQGRGLAVRDQDMTIAGSMGPLDLKLTPSPGMDAEQLGPWNAYYEPRNAAMRGTRMSERERALWQYNRYMHDYLGCVRGVDEGVGAVLDELERSGLDENTIVVYASDQGFFLGEHGWYDKRWIFEESLRTPLIVRWPGVSQPKAASGEIVSITDLAPTFLDATGVEVPAEMQGQSLRGVIAGEVPADWRKSFYYQYYEYPVPHHVRPHHGVVTDRFKLVHFDTEDTNYWELYDRLVDPHELRDVWADPAYGPAVAYLRTELKRLRAELEVPEVTPEEAYGRPRRQR